MNTALALILALTPLAQADSLFEKFFDDFAKNRDAIQTLQTRFSQKTINPDETLLSTGTITYTNPKRLIFRYDNANDPAARHLPTFPSHKHGPAGLIAAPRPSLADVLHEIVFQLHIPS